MERLAREGSGGASVGGMRKTGLLVLALCALLSACDSRYVLREPRTEQPQGYAYGYAWSAVRDGAKLMDPLLTVKEREAICGGISLPYLTERFGRTNLSLWAWAYCATPAWVGSVQAINDQGF